MSRILFPIYGAVCYLVFFGTFLYAIGFVEDWQLLGHPITWLKSWTHGIDFNSAAPSSTTKAILINAVLLSLFAVQHSGMARRGFKAMWTRVLVPKAVERSTYVLAASLCLLILFKFWQPMPQTIWEIKNETVGKAIQAVSLAGWGIVLLATFLINHFHLFGLQQVYNHSKGIQEGPMKFHTPGFYKLVRHPLYVGFIIAFWVTPVMTRGHLMFCVATLGYILVAIQFEEKDLVHEFGAEYENYKNNVRGLIPIPKK